MYFGVYTYKCTFRNTPKMVRENHIMFRHSYGKCYIFQYESQGKSYIFLVKSWNVFFNK